MVYRIRLAALLMLCFGVFAYSLAQDRTERTISGVVINAVTGQPVADATVTGIVSVKTDAEGRFAWADLPLGKHRIIASKTGYLRNQESSVTVALPPTGAHPESIVLKLVPEGVLSGTVYDYRSQAVVNATVIVYAEEYRNGSKLLWELARVTTNDRGGYRVAGLAPGEVVVRVLPPRVRRAVEGANAVLQADVPENELQALFYPSAVEVSQADRVRIPGGAEARLQDVFLARSSLGWIKVEVINETGKPMPAEGTMAPTLRHPAFGVFPSAQTRFNESGMFWFKPDAIGTFDAAAAWSTDGIPMQGTTRVEFRGSDVTVPLVVRRPDATVRLTLVVAPSATVRDVQVEGLSLLAEGVMGTVRLGATDREGAAHAVTYAGKYRFRGIQGLPKEVHIRSARQGSRDILTQEIELTSGTNEVAIVLGTEVATITGIVVDAKAGAVANAVVALLPDSPLSERSDRLTLHRTTFADAAGNFEFAGIPPGRYQVYSWISCEVCYFSRSPSIQGGAYLSEAFMSEFSGKGRALTVESGSTIGVRSAAIERQSELAGQ